MSQKQVIVFLRTGMEDRSVVYHASIVNLVDLKDERPELEFMGNSIYNNGIQVGFVFSQNDSVKEIIKTLQDATPDKAPNVMSIGKFPSWLNPNSKMIEISKAIGNKWWVLPSFRV